MKRLPLPEALKAARKAAGMTQSQVTEGCKWDSTSRYPNYEQGSREPTLADLHTIAKVVAAGGHSFARIVTGEDVVPASQVKRPDREIILAAVKLASGAITGVFEDSFTIETDEDAELFALAIDEVLDDGIVHASDSDLQRFMRKIQSRMGVENGKIGTTRPDGGADRSAGKAQAGDAARPPSGRKRKQASG